MSAQGQHLYPMLSSLLNDVASRYLLPTPASLQKGSPQQHMPGLCSFFEPAFASSTVIQLTLDYEGKLVTSRGVDGKSFPRSALLWFHFAHPKAFFLFASEVCCRNNARNPF